MLHDVNCHKEATSEEKTQQFSIKLDPVGSTVRYEVYWVSLGHYDAVAVVNL